MRNLLPVALGLFMLAGCGGERDAPYVASADEERFLADAADMIPDATPAPEEDPLPPTPEPTETVNPND